MFIYNREFFRKKGFGRVNASVAHIFLYFFHREIQTPQIADDIQAPQVVQSVDKNGDSTLEAGRYLSISYHGDSHQHRS